MVPGACCHRRFCLKQRLWTVGDLRPDEAKEKSLIPCLEPCAVMLEFARQAMRLEQDDKASVVLSFGESEALRVELKRSLDAPKSGEREADFSSPANPAENF